MVEKVFYEIKKEVELTKNEEELRELLVRKLKKLKLGDNKNFFLERDRIDIKYKDVVIETKKYKRLNKKSTSFEDFKTQITGYMKKLNIPYGVLIDCNTIYFFKVNDSGDILEIEKENNSFNLENFEFFLKLLFEDKFEYKEKYLVSSNLIYDFGNLTTNDIMNKFLQKMLQMFISSNNSKKQLFFDEWEKLFRLSETDTDDENTAHEDILKRRNILEKIFKMEINKNNEYKALFILFSTLSIIVKLLMLKLMSTYKQNNFLKKSSINDFKSIFIEIENGSLFESLGILNMGKSDFFSWYIEIDWDNEFVELLEVILNKSLNYKFTTWEDFKDPIKDLYENFIDFDIRHSLGEYYTPQGLSDFIVEKSINQKDRVIDPTCGSGTFITSFLKKKLKEQSLKDILKNNEIVGIDLNPIAVIMAKLTFLLVCHSYLKKEKIFDIEIPIYLGDSSYMPDFQDIDGVKCIKYDYYMDSKIIDMPPILFPLDFVRDDDFIITLNKVEEMINDGINIRKITDYLFLQIEKTSTLNKKIKDEIFRLIEKIVDYHKKNLNTIWLFIFMNYLKPFALGPYDKAVGNPPWVRWSVLPVEYKKRIKNSLRVEGLFSSDKNVGGIDLNICALIANKVLDNLLKIGSHLVFIMPESILHNKSFEGFRKFVLYNAKGELIKVYKPKNKQKVFYEVSLPFLVYDIKKVSLKE